MYGHLEWGNMSLGERRGLVAWSVATENYSTLNNSRCGEDWQN
jgi:hypothetical protein